MQSLFVWFHEHNMQEHEVWSFGFPFSVTTRPYIIELSRFFKRHREKCRIEDVGSLGKSTTWSVGFHPIWSEDAQYKVDWGSDGGYMKAFVYVHRNSDEHIIRFIDSLMKNSDWVSQLYKGGLRRV